MTEEPTSLVLEHLRHIRGVVDRAEERVSELTVRVGRLDVNLAQIQVNLAPTIGPYPIGWTTGLHALKRGST